MEQDLPCPVHVSSDSGLEGETISRDSPTSVRKEDKHSSQKHGRYVQTTHAANPPQPAISPTVNHQRMKRKNGQTKMQSSCKDQTTISRGLEKSPQQHIPHTEAADQIHTSSYGSIK